MANERITLWVFLRFNILSCFTGRYSGDGIIETEVENGVCLHLMVSKLVKAHNSKWGAGKKTKRETFTEARNLTQAQKKMQQDHQ